MMCVHDFPSGPFSVVPERASSELVIVKAKWTTEGLWHNPLPFLKIIPAHKYGSKFSILGGTSHEMLNCVMEAGGEIL